MNIKDHFNQAVMSAAFSLRGNGESRYVTHAHGPFKAMCYVPKNMERIVAQPKSVSVDSEHAQAQEAVAFIDKDNRAVRRARKRGIHVSAS